MSDYSTQANFDSIKSADAHAQGVDGGLNLKTDSGRLAPPATTRADNALYVAPGNVQQLPAPSSVMQANTQHVYNLHARDLQAPATYGDLMVHGEVRDNASSTTNLYTSPVWTDGNGATVNSAQPMPPWNVRSRVMTGKLNVADTGCSTYNMMTVVQESYTSQATRRYGIGYFDGSNIRFAFGLCDGTLETNDSLTYAATGQYCECAAVQGTSNWIAVVSNSATITMYTFTFSGAFVSSTTISTGALTTNPQASTGTLTYNPVCIMQHAGRTFVCYITNPSGANCVATMYDVLAASTMATPLSSSSVPLKGFACISPYTHQTQTGSRYFACVFNGSLYVLGQSAYNVAPVTCAGATSLTFASNTGANYTGTTSGEGTANVIVTGAACIFDANGGVGASASLGVTLFRAYPEQMTTGSVPYGNIWYQSVSVDAFNFTASSSSSGLGTGAITSLTSNVFRTASGALLASKAWSGAPPEANYAGTSNAKSAYCVVRCGAWEPFKGREIANPSSKNQANIYGQPTYFILDHQARVVSRIFESAAPIEVDDTFAASVQPTTAAYSQTTRTTYWGNAPMPTGLGTPMFLAPNNDLSALDVTMPVWVQTDGKPRRVVASAGYLAAYYGLSPLSVVNQPCAINLSVSNQVATVPPVQSGPYTVLSGPMTCIHDGRSVVEANYHFQTHSPIPVMSVSSTTSSTDLFQPGTYYYIAVWEWYDSLGRVHRASPSIPVGANVASGKSAASCAVTVPVPPTSKSVFGGTAYCRVYRSTINNTSGIFYLVGYTSFSAPANNAMSVSFSDTAYPDSTNTGFGTGSASAIQQQAMFPGALTAQPRLYTNLTSDTSSVYTFASTPPPPFVWQTASRGRAFGLAQVLGQHRLYYSSVAQDRFPFEWNVYNYAPVPPDVGDARSVEAIDDKVFIFGTRLNAYLSGTGPATSNTSGVPAINEGFDTVLPLPTPQGCVGTGGPCRGPDGIYFQGFSGIQLLGRDLTISPVGAAVDNITGRQFNNPGQVYGRATMLPSLQSIVWPNAQGAALVYNYLTQKWSTWPLLGNAACLVQRLDGAMFASLQPVLSARYSGVAASSSLGADIVQLGASYAPLYLGNNTAPSLVLETPWILPSGESGGESSVWDVTCTGSWQGAHILKVETCINYQANYSQTVTFNFATNPQFYQARVRPQTTRIWAVRYRITLLPTSTLSAQYLMATLSDLVINSGTKQGTTRLGASLSG